MKANEKLWEPLEPLPQQFFYMDFPSLYSQMPSPYNTYNPFNDSSLFWDLPRGRFGVAPSVTRDPNTSEEIFEPKYANYVLWVDDTRDPKDSVWRNIIYKNRLYGKDGQPTEFQLDGKQIAWAKNAKGFVKCLLGFGMPCAIFFDHDLGDGPDGKYCANYLVEFCLKYNMNLPEYYSQSSNTPGRENILSYLDDFKKFCEMKCAKM